MVYLNFTNLDAETQNRLIATSKQHVENAFGEHLKQYAQKHHIDYEILLDEEAMRNLYNYNYAFNL